MLIEIGGIKDLKLSPETIKYNFNTYPILSSPIKVSGVLNYLQLINLDNGDIYNCNAIELIVLSFFYGGLTLSDLINTLIKKYDYDETYNLVFLILTKYKDLITLSYNKLDDKNKSFFFKVKDYSLNEVGNDKIKFPNIITLFLTDKCNFSCEYCYRIGIKQEGSIKYAKVIEIIEEAYVNHTLKIDFTGGEPLLDKNIVIYVKECIKRRIFPFISTNGFFLTKAMLRDFEEAKLPLIQISLDSLSKDTFNILCGCDGLETVMNNLINCANSKIKVIMRTVLCNLNYHELENIIKFAKSLEIYKLVITPVTKIHNKMTQEDKMFLNSNQLIEAKNIISKYSELMNIKFQVVNKCWCNNSDIISCGALFSSTSILSNGDIVFCSNLPQIKYGNIYNHTIMEAWNSNSFIDIRNNLVNKSSVSDTCSNCEYFNSCYTGCPSLKSAVGLTFNDIDPRCFKYKMQVKHL